MLSSTQIAAIMAQQNQMFMGAAGYAQQISTQMPPTMQGAGTIGSYAMARGPQFPQAAYLPSHQAGFNYGGSQTMGYGFSNRMGGMAVSAMGGAAQLGVAGLGMFGGAMFDPLAGGMAGFGAARAAGMGIGGALGVGALAALPATAFGMAASHAIGSMVTGAQEQSAVNSSLGQFNFINPMSRSGRGFSRSDSMAIGGMLREMQALPELMTSMGELTRIMDKLGQMGAMSGARDAAEFQRRFKESIGTLKTVAQVMGSTMEEALPLFQNAKLMGFHSRGAIIQNAINGQITSGVTGMSTQQVAGLQMQGSQLSFAMGGTRAGGARGVGRIARELGTANQLGVLSNERIMEMTGLEGAEGIAALSGTINEAGYRMAQSSLGNAMTLALGETKDGRYTGQMDADLVSRVRSGQISKNELLHIARQKSAGRNAKISFKAHQNALRSEMVNQTGVQGIMMELQTILGERGWDNPDALNLVMQRYGLGEREASQVIELGKEMPRIEDELASSSEAEVRRIGTQSFMSQHASWEGVKKKIGKKMENLFTEPFKRLGASIGNSISESIDSFTDDIFGRYKTSISDLSSEVVLSARMGNKDAIRKLAEAKSAAGIGGITGQGNDFRNQSMLGNMLNYFSGSQLQGEGIGNELGGFFGGGTYTQTGWSGRQQNAGDFYRGQGYEIYSENTTDFDLFGSGTQKVTRFGTRGERERAAKALREYGAGGTISDVGYRGQMAQLEQTLGASGRGGFSNLDDLAGTLRGIANGSQNRDVLNQDMSLLDRQKIINESFYGSSAVQNARAAMGYAAGQASPIDTAIKAAAARKAGIAGWDTVDIGGLGGAMSGEFNGMSLKQLQDLKGSAIDEASGLFSNSVWNTTSRDEVKAALAKGGSEAKILQGLAGGFGWMESGGKRSNVLSGTKLEELFHGKTLTDEGRQTLTGLGITGAEEQNKIFGDRGKYQNWIADLMEGAGGKNLGALGRVGKIQLAADDYLIEQKRHQQFADWRTSFGDFADRDKAFLGGGKGAGSKAGQAALQHLSRWLSEEGGTGDAGDLAAEIAGLGSKERDYVLQHGPAALRGGVGAASRAAQKFKRGSRKGKLGLADLGLDEAGLAAMGVSGTTLTDLKGEISAAAGGDGKVSAAEEKKIEKILAKYATEGKIVGKGGGEAGMTAPVAKMTDAITKLSEHLKASTETMKAIATKAGVTVEDKTT